LTNFWAKILPLFWERFPDSESRKKVVNKVSNVCLSENDDLQEY
jgi:hypothetical protein